MSMTQPWLITWIIKHGWYLETPYAAFCTLSAAPLRADIQTDLSRDWRELWCWRSCLQKHAVGHRAQREIGSTSKRPQSSTEENKLGLDWPNPGCEIWRYACVMKGRCVGLSCLRLMISIRRRPDAGAAAKMGLGLLLLIDWAKNCLRLRWQGDPWGREGLRKALPLITWKNNPSPRLNHKETNWITV